MNIIKQPSALGSREALRDKVIERESKKPGLKGKIRAFCCHCIYDPYSDGTWLKQVENCTSCDCPLFSVRPKPSAKNEVEPCKSPAH
jgi:hypothetical protein